MEGVILTNNANKLKQEIYTFNSQLIKTAWAQKPKNKIFSSKIFFNPILDGCFRGCSRMGGQKDLPSLKSVTYILQ